MLPPRLATKRRLGLGLEFQRGTVDAVALPGWCRAVWENMTEMAFAGRTMDCGADHAVRAVGGCLDGTGNRIPETRPARTAVILGVRHIK